MLQDEFRQVNWPTTGHVPTHTRGMEKILVVFQNPIKTLKFPVFAQCLDSFVLKPYLFFSSWLCVERLKIAEKHKIKK